MNEFLKCISAKKHSHKLIVGDFNYGHINWKTWTTSQRDNNVEAQFIDAVRDSFFHQHVLKPTRRRGKDFFSLNNKKLQQ